MLVIQAPFYKHISQLLLEGATKKLKELGFEFDVIEVMGSARNCARNCNY